MSDAFREIDSKRAYHVALTRLGRGTMLEMVLLKEGTEPGDPRLFLAHYLIALAHRDVDALDMRKGGR